MNLRWKIAQAAEIRWWGRYLAGKDPIDYRGRKERYWSRILDLAGAGPEPGEAVLDAGCGPAGIFLVLRDHPVDAVDPLLEAYERELPHFRRADFPWVRFHNQPLEEFQPDRLYRSVFCLNAINHVADLDRCLSVLLNALHPEGNLVLSVDVHRFSFLKRLFRLLPGDILHPHQHGLGDYVQKIGRQGGAVRQTVRLKRGGIFDFYLVIIEKRGF